MARFEVQARVIDLLGLQQIANCPTAISELFKNAWDAYAEQVKLDIYLENDQVILWDDGTGMTEDELLHRWLVVGAAGKEDLQVSVEPPEGMEPRPIQGEKGIGRLAVSTIGDTLLLISRSRRPKNPDQPFVALLINWNIVRNEHLRLSDVEIPDLSFSDIDELDMGIVADMVEVLKADLMSEKQAYAWQGVQDEKKRQAALALRQQILDQLDSFQVEMASLRRTIRSWKGHGVIFCIHHLQEDFKRHVEKPGRDENNESFEDLVQLLSNFRNRFEEIEHNDGRNKADFSTDVRRWIPEDQHLRSLFTETATFEPQDLHFYDHRIDVEFDAFGRFKGLLEIYGKPADLPPVPAQPKQALRCGPFRLHLWYFQDKNATSLDNERWTLVSNKLKKFGGLMVYRDDLRVLPYGRRADDWLGIEERRSKGAGFYFFSYRRMFGYVEISRTQNPHLRDKAGREGLIGSVAFRDFKGRLEYFFIYLARQYFSKGTVFFEQKERVKDEYKRARQERKRAAEKRKELREEAAKRIAFIENDGPEQLELAYEKAVSKLGGITDAETAKMTEELVRFENRISQIRGKARFSMPRTVLFARDRDLKRLSHDHTIAFQEFSGACSEYRQKFTNTVREKFPGAEDAASQRRVIENAYSQAVMFIGKAYQELESAADAEMESMKSILRDLRKQEQSRVDLALREITGAPTLEEAKAIEIEDTSDLLAAVSEAAEIATANLREHQGRLTTHLSRYFSDAPDETMAAQTGLIEELSETVDRNLELVQLGLSVEIIDHDLNRLYAGIRTGLSRLRNLVRNAPREKSIVEDLQANFQHFEQRYRLMSPLYRGSYRTKSEIDGNRVLVYCRDFLERPLRSTGVEIEASDAFRSFRIMEVPAIVLPVFVNLVDNSIYWLRDGEERRVVLDRHDDVLTICDTGPGIHPTLLEDVFEPFFSSKQPMGRGLGLYIARANLKRYGHEIWATDQKPYRKLSGACICIRFHEDVVLSE